MKRIFPSLLLCTVWSSAMATNLQGAVDTIINRVDPSINMGVVVVDLNTGETLYQKNPTRPFVIRP